MKPRPSRLPFWVRRTHKWLSLVVGVQAVLWVLGGLYMVAVPLTKVHGDHLASAERAPLAASATRLDPAALAARHPGMTGFTYKMLGGREVVEVRQGKQAPLLDAASGAPLGRLDRAQVEALARAAYTGDGRIRAVEWLDRTPPEAGSRPAPLWAVHFDDALATTLYYSPVSGELLTRRSALWRWFDFAWMLHIMDYEEREDINNGLLQASSLLAFVLSASGAWLLVLWLRRRFRR